MNLRRPLVVLAALASLTTARAQEPAPPPQPVEEEPLRLRPGMQQSAQQDAEREMRELFLKVEARLREIDRLLSDAGAGDTQALGENLDSGMGDLLQRTQDNGREVLQGIDRILELAEQLDGRPSGSGSGKPQSEGQQPSPLDKRGSERTQREQTPSQPESSQKPGNEKPDQQQQDGQQDGQQDPRDPRASHDKDPKNQPGKQPPASGTEGPSRPSNDGDRWGDLPVHARDIFRVEGGSDMPVQYRDWIDSYYRRLNQKKP